MKTFLEERSLYDKNRKITKLEGNVFGVPIRNRTDFESCLNCVPPEMKDVISLHNLDRALLPSSYSAKTLSEQLLRAFCATRWLSLQVSHLGGWRENALKFHRIEIVGDIVVFNKQSTAGEKSGVFWDELVSLPSVVSTPSPLDVSLITLFGEFLRVYNATRVGVHDEIDCGSGGITAVIGRSQATEPLAHRVFFEARGGRLGDCASSGVQWFGSCPERRAVLVELRARDVREWQQHGENANGARGGEGRVRGGPVRCRQ